MNPGQQKNHATALAQVRNASEEFAEATEDQFAAVNANINNERTHRLKLADEQRSYVDAADSALRRCCQERWDETAQRTKLLNDRISELRYRGFWSRLNWLLRGL